MSFFWEFNFYQIKHQKLLGYWLRSASWTQKAPKSAQEHPKTRPGAPQATPQEPPRAPLRPQGAPQEWLRTPQERPERASELPRVGSGQPKWSARTLPKPKKSNASKVLRDPLLPTFEALRTAPDRPWNGQNRTKSTSLRVQVRLCTVVGCGRARQWALASQFARAWRVCTCTGGQASGFKRHQNDKNSMLVGIPRKSLYRKTGYDVYIYIYIYIYIFIYLFIFFN